MNGSNFIVSLWNGPPNEGEYLGCGVCIASDLVLTAKHVGQSTAKEELRVGLIPDRDSGLSVTEIQLHPDRDIQLMRLSRAHRKNAISCQMQQCLGNGMKVSLHAYNKAEKCTKGPIEVGLSNWAEPNGWEFHTEPVPGMSGGAVLLNGKLVGIIQAKDETENSGIIIPLDAIKGFLEPHLQANKATGTGVVGASNELPQEDGRFKGQIARRISRVLNHQDAEPVRQVLLDEFGIDEGDGKKALTELAGELLARKVDEAIRDYLLFATQECIEQGGQQYEKSRDAIDRIIKIAEELLGWLVLSSVDEQAIAELLPVGVGDDSLYFILGHGTLGGVELAMSRRFQRKAELLGKESPADQRSPYNVSVDPRYFSESDEEIVRKLLLEIWNKVFNSPEEQKKENEKLTRQNIKMLNATLRDLRKRKRGTEHYYIAFQTDSIEPQRAQEIFRMLLDKDKLNQMTVVEYGTDTGSKVLIIDEEDVIAAINGFYRGVKNQDKIQE